MTRLRKSLDGILLIQSPKIIATAYFFLATFELSLANNLSLNFNNDLHIYTTLLWMIISKTRNIPHFQNFGEFSVLANIYLHDLDVHMSQQGYRMVRYADDFVILSSTEEEAKKALAEVKQWMVENVLALHPNKTRIGNCVTEGDGFEFLGYRFECSQRTVRKSSLKKLRDTIRKRTKRTVSGPIEEFIENLNPVLIGWFNYFKHAHKWTFSTIDGFIQRRLRAIFRRREKRPGKGYTYEDHNRWPNAFFATHELFTMKEAHAHLVASRSR